MQTKKLAILLYILRVRYVLHVSFVHNSPELFYSFHLQYLCAHERMFLL